MRQFQTTVLERKTAIRGAHATEPFEAGWASEAIYFVEAHALAGGTLRAVVQISPDGIRWIDEGSACELAEPGQTFVRVAHFGGFLRLALDTPENGDSDTTALVTVHLALKS